MDGSCELSHRIDMSSLRVYAILFVIFVAYVYAQTTNNCRDLAADCNCKIGLCANQMYRTLLMRMCNLTCGFCTATGK